MIAAYASAALVLLASTSLGHVILRAFRASVPAELSLASGMAAVLVFATPLVALPGHGLTAALILGALATAAALVGRRAIRFPRPGVVLVGAAAAAVASLPFLANGRFGLLGASIDDDLREHLAWSEALRIGDSLEEALVYPHYPLAAHSVVAALAAIPGVDVASATVGLMLACIAASAITAYGMLVDRATWIAAPASVIVALPYLVAAFYGWGGFKEVIVGFLFLSFTAFIAQAGVVDVARSAAVPALIAAAATLVNAYPTLAWFGGTLLVWCVGRVVLVWRLPSSTNLVRAARWATFGLLAFAVCLAVDLGDLVRFRTPLEGGFREHISALEVSGVWFSADMRFPGDSTLGEGLTWLAVWMAGYSFLWWIGRRELAVPAAVATALLIYIGARASTHGYPTAKTLAIAAPLVMLMLLRPLLPERGPSPRTRWRAWTTVAAVLILLGAFWSSTVVLRYSPVSSEHRTRDLADVRPLVKDRRVVFLGEDHFIHWKLFGALSSAFNLASDVPFPTNPEKPFVAGSHVDFDSVPAPGLDAFEFALAPRTTFASSPPSNWSLVRETRFYRLWRRTGSTTPRRILPEGGAFGATLDCPFDAGQRFAVREAPIVVGVGNLASGGQVTVRVPASAGRWELSLQYQSPVGIRITAPGFDEHVPPSLDVIGPFWRVGELEAGGPFLLTLAADEQWLAKDRVAVVPAIVLTRPRLEPIVASRVKACGRYVDWYDNGS